MLTRNNSGTNNISNQVKVKQSKKRRHSQIGDTNNLIEPVRKLRKVRAIKPEYDENNSENMVSDEIVDNSTSEFKDFIKHFSIPSNIYKYLSVRHKSNPVMLKRCLSYNKNLQSEILRSNVHSIADHLSTVQCHDNTIALLKGKPLNFKKVKIPMKIILKFEQFLDNKLQKDWETINACICVDIVHFHRDNRKNKDGFSTRRVIDKQKIYCNRRGPDESEKYVIDVGEVMAAASCYRVYKSMLHFKILANEKKLFSKNISQEKKCDDLYPVTYEAMMPFYSNKDERNMHKETYFIKAGKYEIFPRVTNMEECDDSLFDGVCHNEYNEKEEQFSEMNSQWVKVDDLQTVNANKNNTRFVFTLSCEEQPQPIQKPFKNRNKIPIVQLSPIKNGDLCPSSKQLKIKTKIDINLAFKFLIKDTIVQWTQTSSLTCPWCHLNFTLVTDLFTTLTKMMMHLNYMHPKFTFKCKRLSNRTLFQKSLAKKFMTIDVSLTGVSATDWDLGLMFTEKLPARRMPLSEVIYTKYQREMPSLYRPNHRRDYCHTWSSRKNKYLEFDIDSEAEENLGWMYDHYWRKVEEFSDLNHIEKRVIQIWNESLLRYGMPVADQQMRMFVEHFVADLCDDRSPSGQDRLTEVAGLRNTLLVHLVNLIDFGVLPPATMVRVVRHLDEALDNVVPR